MTTNNNLIGASSAKTEWKRIYRAKVHKSVYRLQMRIAKARQDKHFGKVKALQRLLTRIAGSGNGLSERLELSAVKVAH